jgi:hypothetical protein
MTSGEAPAIRRLVIPVVGLAIAGLIAGLVPVPGLEWQAVFLLMVLIEILLAAVLAIGLAWGGRSSATPIDARPPDGVVPIVCLGGVRGTANAINPNIQAFLLADETSQCPDRPRSSGEPRALLGRLGIFSLFVGRDGSSWSDRQIAEAFAGIERMGRWLEREAARWGVPLNVELVDTYFRADDPEEETVVLTNALDPFQSVIDEADADFLGVASASRASAALGFADLGDLIGSIDPRTDHDLTVWFVHLLRAGRSSAIAKDRFRFPGVGIALCYARESSPSRPLDGPPYVDPTTLAHELLHLFGATDKYGTRLSRFAGRSVTGRDVMRLDETRLGRLRIEPLTASEIGWTASVAATQLERPASN